MDVFIFDITQRKFKDEEDFVTNILCYYPSGCMLLATLKQQKKIEKFGRAIRWIDASNIKLAEGKSIKYNEKTRKNDVLVHDSILGSYLIVTAKELRNLK